MAAEVPKVTDKYPFTDKPHDMKIIVEGETKKVKVTSRDIPDSGVEHEEIAEMPADAPPDGKLRTIRCLKCGQLVHLQECYGATMVVTGDERCVRCGSDKLEFAVKGGG